MANEAVLLTRWGYPVSMTCVDGTGIEKGAILRLSGNNIVAASNGAADFAGGIAAGEKIASDGTLEVAVWRNGARFKVTLSGSCSLGDPLVTDTAPNHLKSGRGLSDALLSGSRIFGTALEAGTTGQTVLMELNIQSQGAG